MFNDENAEKVLTGMKRVTTRHEVHGELDDEFTVKGRTFRIVYLMRVTLGWQASNLYRREGYQSRQEFIDGWNRCYPDRPFNESERVWAHFFEEAYENDSYGVEAEDAACARKEA